MAGRVDRLQMPAALAVGRRTQIENGSVVEKLPHFDPPVQRLRCPRMREDRYAITLRTGVGCANMVGVMMRQHHTAEAPAFGLLSIEQLEQSSLLGCISRTGIEQVGGI